MSDGGGKAMHSEITGWLRDGNAPATLEDISDAMPSSYRMTSKALRELVEAGVLVRRPNPVDARRSLYEVADDD